MLSPRKRSVKGRFKFVKPTIVREAQEKGRLKEILRLLSLHCYVKPKKKVCSNTLLGCKAHNGLLSPRKTSVKGHLKVVNPIMVC